MKTEYEGLTCETVSDVAGRRPEASLVPTFEGRELDAKDRPEIRYRDMMLRCNIAIGDMQRLQIMPGDVFVLNVDEVIEESTAERLRVELRKVLGQDPKFLVLCGGLTLGVMGVSIDKPSVAAGGVASPGDLLQSK